MDILAQILRWIFSVIRLKKSAYPKTLKDKRREWLKKQMEDKNNKKE